MTTMKEIFENYKNIAVVGFSRDLSKAAHTVPGYMKKQGYILYPVNPNAETIMGLKCYKSLSEIPEKIDMVNIFRPAQDCLDLVEEAVSRHNLNGDIKMIWLQLGIINNEAKMIAEENGIEFIQDKCIYVEHKAVR